MPEVTISHRNPEKRSGEPPVHDDQAFIKWIPIVVPLFAVLLVLAVIFIEAGVLL